MNILVVDDEKKIADILAQRLQIRGHEAVAVYDGRSALERLHQDAFAGVLLDLRLPDMDGVEVLKAIGADYPHIQVVVISGHAGEDEFQNCLDLGALACFQKPADIARVLQVLTPEKED